MNNQVAQSHNSVVTFSSSAYCATAVVTIRLSQRSASPYPPAGSVSNGEGSGRSARKSSTFEDGRALAKHGRSSSFQQLRSEAPCRKHRSYSPALPTHCYQQNAEELFEADANAVRFAACAN